MSPYVALLATCTVGVALASTPSPTPDAAEALSEVSMRAIGTSTSNTSAQSPTQARVR